jgi:hypothetical protein
MKSELPAQEIGSQMERRHPIGDDKNRAYGGKIPSN